VWRLLLNCLPTNDNLVKRGVLPVTSQRCVGGCGNLEDATHLFLHCNFFRQIWLAVYDWLGFVLVTPLNISYHLAQFGSFGGFSKRKKDIIHLV